MTKALVVLIEALVLTVISTGIVFGLLALYRAVARLLRERRKGK